MSRVFDYAIVGSGLYGATLAYLLSNKGYQVIVIEEKPMVGGSVRTEVLEESGIPVHIYGPHIFHTSNRKVWDFMNNLCTMIPFVNSPIAIAPDDEVYHMPFNMDTFYKIYNTRNPESIKNLIQKDTVYTGSPEDNLENKAISLVGRRIYDLLIKGYTEKQWGKPCAELPADIITRLPLRFTWNNNYFNDVYQGIPDEGYTYLIDKLLETSVVMTESKITCKNISALKSIANVIIYTGRLDDFYENTLGSLDYRGLEFNHELSNKTQGTAVINYTSKDILYTRTTEHKYFYPARNIDDSLPIIRTYEYPASPEKSGNYFYPINNERNTKLHKEYMKHAMQDGIYIGGRLATYRYINMDKAIEEAMSMASNLLIFKE